MHKGPKKVVVINCLVFCCLGIDGCRHGYPSTPPSASLQSNNSERPFPIITQLVSRHFTIVVASGPREPVYTVMGEQGNRLTNQITLAAMKLSNPDLFHKISPALAMGDIDASVMRD